MSARNKSPAVVQHLRHAARHHAVEKWHSAKARSLQSRRAGEEMEHPGASEGTFPYSAAAEKKTKGATAVALVRSG